MFVLTLFINFILYSVAMAEGGNIFINKAILQDENSDTWYSKPTTDHVRCFCNLPICISTGYICKSTSGGCFSNLLHQPPPTYNEYKGLHGCLELLTDKEQRDWCRANPNSQIGRKKKHHPRSLLYCCQSDMCNHVDNPETTNLMDESVGIFNDRENDRGMKNSSSQQINALTYDNSEVWFKVATIAVPIFGAIIVLVLVVLAIRLLRTESHNHTRHKLGTPYVPTQNKNSNKYHEHYKKSHYPMRKECIPTDHTPVYFHHNVEEFQQIRTPLVQKEQGHSSPPMKNTNTSTKYLPSQPRHRDAEEEDIQYSNVPNKNSKFEFSNHRGLPTTHQNNLFCDVDVTNSFIKDITYDKANIKNDYENATESNGKMNH